MSKRLVSSAELAQMKGVSPRAVRQAITDGRISGELVDGKYLLDAEQALKDWDANTAHPMSVVMDFDLASEQLAEIHPETGSRPCTLAEAKALKEFFQGFESKLKCMKMTGELIPLDRAKAEADILCSRIKSELSSLPQSFITHTAHVASYEIAKKQAEIIKELIKKILLNITSDDYLASDISEDETE